jgi:hypothetical protein
MQFSAEFDDADDAHSASEPRKGLSDNNHSGNVPERRQNSSELNFAPTPATMTAY